jgi:branched-chain amino acid transport system substrate-binding protein
VIFECSLERLGERRLMMHSPTVFAAAVLVCVGLVVCATVVSGCGKEPPTERIGVIVPLTGGAAEFGKWARRGVDLGIADVNAQGAGSGRQFAAVYEDHQMDSKTGLSAFKKLVDVDKVVGVITSGSGVVLAIAPDAERTQTVQINYAAVNPNIRKAGEYTFTLVNDSDAEADAIARLAYEKLGIKQMAILYANAAYGVGAKDAIVRSFERAGGKVMGSVAFAEDFTDARAQLLQLKDMAPPAIYFVATIKDSGRLLKQAKELGLKTQWLSYNAFESPEVLKIAGDAAEGVIYTSSNLFDLPNPGTVPERFLKAYTEKYGQRPNLYEATAYDAVQLLANAWSAGDGSREGVRRYLASAKDYQGASGSITFDQDGCVRKPVFLKTVHNGAFVLYKP